MTLLIRFQGQNNLSHVKGTQSIFPSELGKSLRGEVTEYMHLQAIATRYDNTSEKQTDKIEEPVWDCYLPMPRNLQHTQSHSYENKEIGQLGQTATDILGNDDKKSLNGAIDNATQQVIGAFRTAYTGVSGFLTGTDTESIIRLGTQVKPNPHMEVLYNGSSFRSFNFQWDFVPESKDEHEKLASIISKFRFYSAPEFPKDDNQMWINFPNTWRVRFLHAKDSKTNPTSGKKNEWLPEIYGCVCSNVDVSFNDGQPRWHSRLDSEGAPIQTTLRLTFNETSISSKDLIFEKDKNYLEAEKISDGESETGAP